MKVSTHTITMSLLIAAFPLFFLSGLLKSPTLFYSSMASFGLGVSFLAVDLFRFAFGIVGRSNE